MQSFARRAAENVISKMKEKSTDRVMEKLSDYTCDPGYMSVWSKFMENPWYVQGDNGRSLKTNKDGY